MLLTVISVGFVACDHDLNKDVDFRSPTAVIDADTFEVSRNGSVDLRALLKDESGISFASLSYANWKVNDEKVFEANYPGEYLYTFTVKVPADAEYEWEEDYVKHDGSRFKIIQRYHKLSLTCYDGVRNKNVFYFYIKVN